MTKKSGDEPARIVGVDPNVETKIIPPESDAYKTNKISDPSDPPRSGQPHPTLSTAATIGDYRLIRKIGEGGMGVVYEAEQQHPRRLVALKVIRGGLHADDYHVKMFEREIQALARLKHPGIASIYESGRSEDGQIFFAMELVHGTSLTEFVEDARVSGTDQMADVDSQLALFSKICDVVSYAHQRGVIHRDLKPQNILVVDEKAEDGTTDSASGKVGVKILDFGLARITDPDIAGDESGLSQIGQIKGTLLYMSPEQVRGRPDDIDVRSDVYSLGVMLYEMLTGQMPYDLSQVSLPEAIRIICEETPKMPSKAWTASTKRSGRIDTDVETIILKALEKEPDRRYQSVSAMMDDIERYLHDQPILARPPSPYYQFRKLVARHKAAFASIAVIFLMLLGFGIVMAAQSVRIANERDKAEQARTEAEVQRSQAEKARNDAVSARNDEAKQRTIAEDNLARAESETKRANEEKTKAQNAQKAEAEQRKLAQNSLIEARRQKDVADEQTTIAQKQKSIADQKTVEANEQKNAAENEAEANRRLLYDSQINLAQSAWENTQITRMEELLANQFPKPGQKDLRGFEWYYLWRLNNRNKRTLPQPGSVDRVNFSPDGNTLLVSYSNWDWGSGGDKTYGTVVLNVATGKELYTISGYKCLAFSPDGSKLALTDEVRSTVSSSPVVVREVAIRVWDLKTRQFSPLQIKRTLNGGLSSSIATNASFSQDGSLLALTEAEKLELWNLDSATIVSSFIAGKDERFSFFSDAKFSPDGKVMVTTSIDLSFSYVISGTKMTFWDLNTGKEIANSQSDESDLYSLAFSPDGATLATGGLNRTIKLWDVSTKKELAVLSKGRSEQIFSIVNFSHDGKILATNDGREVNVYDVSTKQKISTLKAHDEAVSSLSFSPDSKTLATGSADKKIKLWNIPLEADSTTLKQQSGSTLSPDGTILATTSKEQLNLWDFMTNKQLTSFEPAEIEKNDLLIPPEIKSNPVLPKGKVGFHSPEFSTDGKVMSVKRGSSSLVEFWDVSTRKRIASTSEKTSSYVVLNDRSLLITVSTAGTVRLWDTGRRLMISSFVAWTPDSVNTVLEDSKFSPNGKFLALATGPDLRVLDVSSGGITVYSAKINESNFLERNPVIIFSRDSTLLAIMSFQGVKLIDLRTSLEIFKYTTGNELSMAREFSYDGKLLAIASGRDVLIFDTANGKNVGVLRGHAELIVSIAISQDGTRLATASRDKTVKVWDVSSGQALLTFNTETTGLTFTPDGKTLIAGGYFDVPAVVIWRGATDEEIQNQRGH